MSFVFVDDLKKFFLDNGSDNFDITLELTPATMAGELTINCFKIAKAIKLPPMVVAEKSAEFLRNHKDILEVEVIKAFVNITLKACALHRDVLQNTDDLLKSCVLDDSEKTKILIEYSAPNTNKPQHLGHVRNNTLGMSLASLLKRVGHDVVEINLVNDRGIHICKSMLAYKLTGNNITPETENIKGDHLVGNFYVKFNSMLEQEIAQLKLDNPELANKNSEELFLETNLGKEAQSMLQKWEQGDTEVRELWEKMNAWVFAGFAETYKRMGISFDHTYLESQTYLLGKDIIANGLKDGVFSKRADGAIIVDLGKLGEKVVLRSDGTSVYITQDIGTTLKKYDDYQPNSMVWVVGDEQNLHFKMLFEIMAKLGYTWADKLFHLSYGMVNLPSGKMKSREGTVVDADELFDEMVNLACAGCRERANASELSEEEITKRGEIIGMGALKFMLLKFNPKTTMMFDPAASIKFEGDTGPYVQYVCARINSIERKVCEQNANILIEEANWSLLNTPEEKNLSVIASQYPNILKLAASKKDCSSIVEYLIDLAKAFNRFYRECPVLTAENSELQKARLQLAVACRKVLVDGLNTLTINVPDAM